MIPCVLFINGTRQQEYHAWPAVPRIGETMDLGGITHRITRVHWIASGGTLIAYIHLKEK